MSFRTNWTRLAGVLLAGTLAGVLLVAYSSKGGGANSPDSSSGTGIFTTSHPSVLSAVREFFDIRSAPVQPIQFTHKLHLQNGMQCVDCHQGVDKGPVAGIPSVSFCMTCHQVIATDRPGIKKVAGYLQRGEDIPWQRVYYYQPSAHVRFDHAPHIRAGVECASCHGDMKQQTVAVRSVILTMGYCLNCHRAKKASIDCTTCHF